jgi:hypothetical protein
LRSTPRDKPFAHCYGLLQLKNGEVKGRQTPVGIIPTAEELNLEGVDMAPEDLETILSIDVERWRQEIGFRQPTSARTHGTSGLFSNDVQRQVRGSWGSGP